jgi:hypothetical protein
MHEVTGTDPPKPGNGRSPIGKIELLNSPKNIPDSKRFLSSGLSSTSNLCGLQATGNLEPATATIKLTQGRFAFDGGEPFNDSHIEGYLRVFARALTDGGVRAFLRARFAYQTFQRLGTPESRRFAWHAIWLACRQSSTKGRQP